MNKTFKPGDIVRLMGDNREDWTKFVVLDPAYKCPNGKEGVFILTKNAQEESPFGDNNNYAESALMDAINEWDDDLARWFAEEYIFSRRIDLTTMDGHGHYGDLLVEAAPLTLDEARKYADIIPNPDMPCWLATGWGGHGYFGSTLAWGVLTDGSGYSYDCSSSYGIRPALVVSASMLVVKETVEEKTATRDLSQVPTEDLLTEIQRRINEKLPDTGSAES